MTPAQRSEGGKCGGARRSPPSLAASDFLPLGVMVLPASSCHPEHDRPDPGVGDVGPATFSITGDDASHLWPSLGAFLGPLSHLEGWSAMSKELPSAPTQTLGKKRGLIGSSCPFVARYPRSYMPTSKTLPPASLSCHHACPFQNLSFK